MRPLARRALHFILVAVAISISSVNGYAGVLAAFDIHAHGHHGLHSHPSHDHHGIDVEVDPVGLEQDHQDDNPASSDQRCTHVHVHCCSTFAVPAAECTLKVAHYDRAAVPVAVTHIPPGQLASPLFRPPRTIA